MSKRVRTSLTASLGLIAVLTLGASVPAQANVENFHFDEWASTYELRLDDDGRVIADVTERAVPVFPEHDQNRGIVRAVMKKSFGAPTAPRGISIVDENGERVPFEVEDEDNLRYILVGDDRFVHGKQTYNISYEMRDVIAPMDARADGGTGVDEFYWDLIPVDRPQRVDTFSASIALSEELAGALTGDFSCYAGRFQENLACDMTFDEASRTFTVAEMPLGSREGVTVAIGFTPGVVVQPPARSSSWLTDTFPFIPAVLAALGAIGVGVLVRRQQVRARTHRGTIIAQYTVPDYLPPLLSAEIVGTRHDAIPAEFVHLAVGGAVQIEDAGKRPSFRLVNPELAKDPLDTHTLSEMFDSFGKTVDVAGVPVRQFKVPKQSEKFSSAMTKLKAHAKKDAMQRGYFTRERNPQARTLALVTLGIGLVAFITSLIGVVQSRESSTLAFGISCLVVIGSLVMLVAGLVKHRVHTPLGAESYEYLLGVKEFISVAEQQRIEMLQSYSGAEREADVVKLYEHLLPYAMMFGLEKEWLRVLRIRYEQTGTSPAWYPAMHVGALSGFDRSLSAMQSSVASAASYTSSSSGGSSGGGFSGGGGGGGSVGGR